MLAALSRSTIAAALFAIALGVFGAAPAFGASDKAPPKKRWEKLRDDPIDYAPFERRRAENMKLGVTALNDALKQGFAKVDELGTTRTVDDPALNKGLTVEVQKLMTERLGLKAPPIEIILVDDLGAYDDVLASGQNSEVLKTALAKESTNFTVASTGGGAIVLGLSVLKLVKSYDEFDFLIGHEVSHILYDHFTEDEKKEKISKIIAVAVVIAALATRRSDADTQDAVAWSSLGLIVANGFLGPAWDRGQEEEADELGFELLLESSRSPDGSRNVLEWYQKRDDAQKAYLDLMCGPDSAGERFLKGLFASAIGIRIPDKGYDPNNPLCQQRRDLFAALLSDHPETKERKKDLEKYQTKFYPEGSKVGQTMLGDKSFIDTLSPGGEMSVLGYSHDGIEAFHHGDFDAAKRLALAIPEKGAAEQRLPVLELKFYVANMDTKQRGQALQYLDLATKVPEKSKRISELAEAEYVKDARWDDAIKIVRRRGQRGLAEPIEVLPRVIRYLRLAGKLKEVEVVFAECLALEKPAITLACEAMAHPPPPPEPPAAPVAAPADPSASQPKPGTSAPAQK